MPRTDDVLTSLIVMSKVKANQRLNTREGYLTIESDGWTAQVCRLMSPDGRQRTLDTLDTLYGEAFEIVRTSTKLAEAGDGEETRHGHTVLDMTRAMGASIDGLSNLKKTYQEDVGVCSRLDVFVERIRQNIADARASNASLFEDDSS